MNQEPKSSGSFSPHARRPRRGPRRPSKRPTEKPAEEAPAIAARVTKTIAETISSAPETRDRATPLAEAPAVKIATPLPSALASERAPAMGQSPPIEQSHQQPRGHSPDRPQHFRQRPSPPPPPAQKLRSLQQASQEVLGIIERLNDVLCDMEQVSKMLDDVEIQQRSDEKEIESLRNALRQFQNPPHPRHPPQRDRDRGRSGSQTPGHDRYRERSPQHRQHAPGEPRPPQPPPEAQSAPAQPKKGPEDPESHT